jgi:hypothetical protein
MSVMIVGCVALDLAHFYLYLNLPFFRFIHVISTLSLKKT